MENRNGLVVEVRPDGRAEREAALGMAANLPGDQRVTGGSDQTPRRATEARELKATPHLARNKRRRSAIDRRTTRHPRSASKDASGWKRSLVG